ncbi:MAG: hypothetical protein Q9163_003393 [Psora crenata]
MHSATLHFILLVATAAVTSAIPVPGNSNEVQEASINKREASPFLPHDADIKKRMALYPTPSSGESRLRVRTGHPEEEEHGEENGGKDGGKDEPPKDNGGKHEPPKDNGGKHEPPKDNGGKDDIADKTSKKMEKKHVSLGKGGMKIGVKEVKTENYVDQTQRHGHRILALGVGMCLRWVL